MNKITQQISDVKLGSEIIVQAIIDQGNKVVFGYPGGCVIPLFDALLNHKELDCYLVRHEQAATHAADGLARVTGEAQVVIATSGPGATNCLTGMATALMDSVPMVVITGQVRRAVIGTDAFQETNVVGVSRPITKYNYLVTDIKDLQYTIREAFYIANSGRPGPVLVDIPLDIQYEKYPYQKNPPAIEIRHYQTAFTAEINDVKKAWKMISEAKKPMIYAGHGVNNEKTSKLLTEFINKTGIPIGTTLLGQGVYSVKNDLGLGMLGMHGTYAANMAMTECDLCLVLGARFDDRVTGKVETFLKQSKIIHVDLDPRSLNKIKKADLPILADSGDFLAKILPLSNSLNINEWQKHVIERKNKFPPPNYNDIKSEPNKLRPEFVVSEISKITKGEAYIVTDVGQHQMFTSLHYQFNRAASHITSGGLGTMGFCLPAAYGIATLKNDYPVISISGDGGFQMNIQELATIRAYSLNVKIFIFNNNNLGMVKQWQDFFWNSRYSSTIFDFNPSFVSVGKAYDIPSFEVKEKAEVGKIIKKALSMKGPVLVEFKIDPDAHVYPMVPAGASLTDIILGDNIDA